MSDYALSDKSGKDAVPLGRVDALAILYLEKQDLANGTPEELVGRFIEAHDRIVKEFARQKEVRNRRLNPLPL